MAKALAMKLIRVIISTGVKNPNVIAAARASGRE
jgi:hypothetical protein